MKRSWKTSELWIGVLAVSGLFVARRFGLSPQVFAVLVTVLGSLYILGRGIYKRFRTYKLGWFTSEFVVLIALTSLLAFECFSKKLIDPNLACSCITTLVVCWFISRSLAKELRPQPQLIR